MPNPRQQQLQERIARIRGKLEAAERKLGELRAAYVRGEIAAAQAGDEETQLLTLRDGLRASLHDEKAMLLKESAQWGDAIAAGALDPRMPLALLPVRLETRYRDDALLVRIYPDEIHVDAHDPGVSEVEREAWTRFRKAIEGAMDLPPMREAFARFARDIGVARAAHLAKLRHLGGVPARPPGYARPPRAALLPECFAAHARLDDGRGTIVHAVGGPVREPLALAPDPARPGAAGEGSLDADSRWMTEFLEAEAAGMALRLALPDARVQVAQLLVYGVRAGSDPATAAAEWETLLAGQHAVGGISLPPPGSATNALPGERTLYDARPEPLAVYERELAFEVHTPRDASEDPRPRRLPHYLRRVLDPASGRWIERGDRFAPAVRLAEALGLSPEVFGWLDGAADPTLQGEPPMLGLLRGAFEPGLRRAFGGGIPLPVQMGMDLLGSGCALGPCPTLMIRSQPYGVLPVAVGRDAESGSPEWDALWAGAASLREDAFAAAAAQAPRIGGRTPADPVERLIELLQTEGVAIAADVRLLLDGAMAQHVFAGAADPLATQLRRRQEEARELYARLGGAAAAKAPLTERVLLAEAGASLPLVMPADPAPAERPSAYLSLLADRISPADLIANVLSDFTPRALLFHAARIALLEAAEDDTRRILLAAGVATEADFEAPGGRLAALRDRLQSPTPAGFDPSGRHATLGALLADRDQAVGLIHQRYAELRGLAALDPARLELLFGAGLGLYANRLDALYTARAAQRLFRLRSDNLLGPAPDGFVRGVQLGAFGWVGAIPRARAARSAGYVLAPGVQHALAAGVLLSADHARRIDYPAGPRAEDYAVELSSRRTREALALLDGLREGQALPALIGYRIERALVEAGGTAPALIARLRAIASTAARPIGAGGAPLPEAAAEAVCDGLALVRRATAELTAAPDIRRLVGLQPPALDAAQADALQSALRDARDAVDATADVLLAESVFQLVNGNPSRAGGATDVLSGAVPPPDRLDMLHPPERGIAVNHRLLLALDPHRSMRDGWMTGSPRGLADPDLECWLGQLLPLPKRILIRRLGADGSPNGELYTLHDFLARMPGDEPPLGPLDLAYAGDAPQRIARGPLEARLLAAGAAFTGDAEARFDWGRDPQWPAESSSLEEAVAIAAAARAVLGHARALQAEDLPGAVEVDQNDLDARRLSALDAALAARVHVDAARTDPAARPRARRWAEAFGLPVAADDADGWVRTSRDLGDRIAVAESGGPLRDRIAALFDAQPVLPRLIGADSGWCKAFHAGLAAAVELRAFATRAARVRPPVAAMQRLETLALRSDDNTGLHALAVSQTPWAPGDAWVGARGVPPRGRTAFVTWHLRGDRALEDPASAVCGLLLDRWTDVVPDAGTDAAVAFHIDAPGTAAPNAILLCVPEPGLESWSEDGVLAHLLEAEALARLRTAQPHALGGLAQFAPLALIDNGRHQPSFGHTISEDFGS